MTSSSPCRRLQHAHEQDFVLVTNNAVDFRQLYAAQLLRLKASGMLNDYQNLSAYVARGEARSAYRRAFGAPLTDFTGEPAIGL